MENIELVYVLCLKLQRADEEISLFHKWSNSWTKPKLLFDMYFILICCVLQPFHLLPLL